MRLPYLQTGFLSDMRLASRTLISADPHEPSLSVHPYSPAALRIPLIMNARRIYCGWRCVFLRAYSVSLILSDVGACLDSQT